MKVDTNPMIQMKTPTIEMSIERKAKGSPKRNPKGLHSQLSSQHIAAAAAASSGFSCSVFVFVDCCIF